MRTMDRLDDHKPDVIPRQREDSAALAPAPIISPHSVPRQVAQARGDFAAHSESFSVRTCAPPALFHDITDLAHAVVARSAITAGTVTVSTRHTTCGVVVQESEPLLLRDMADRLQRYASPTEEYRHNDFSLRTVNMCDGECANGHAHCQHLLLGAAVTLPVSEERLMLGLWQRLFLVELDRPRVRQYSIHVIGVRTPVLP